MFDLFLHEIIIVYNCFYFLADSASMSNFSTKNKPISIKLDEKNCVNINKNEISKLYFSK